MLNVLLIVHLILALCLSAVVLLQRSEGGALGIGGGGGGGGLVSARGAATALTKVTWGIAACFLATSILLTVLAQRDVSTSVVGGAGAPAGNEVPTLPGLPGNEGGSLLPPQPVQPAPTVPPAAE